MGGDVASRVFGVDAEGVGIPRKECGKGVAGGGLGQNHGRADVVSAPKVIVEIGRIIGG